MMSDDESFDEFYAKLNDIVKTSKSKSMTLKSVDEVERSGFDDDLSAIEISYLTKNFRNFLKNNNRRARGNNTAKPRNFRRNDPTKVNNTKKPKEKVGQPSIILWGNNVLDVKSMVM